QLLQRLLLARALVGLFEEDDDAARERILPQRPHELLERRLASGRVGWWIGGRGRLELRGEHLARRPRVGGRLPEADHDRTGTARDRLGPQVAHQFVATGAG